MKIGIFAREYPVLSQTFISNQFNALNDLGVDVTMFANIINSKGKESNLEEIGKVSERKIFIIFEFIYNIIKLALNSHFKFIFEVARNNRLNLIDKLRALKIKSDENFIKLDVMIVHFGPNGIFIQELINLGLIESKLAVVFHGYDLSRYNVLERCGDGYKRMFDSNVICLPVSSYWEGKLIEMGCHSENLQINKMGINPSKFSFTNRTVGDKIRLIQVGRLTEKKSILDTINAVIKVKQKIDVHLDVIGDGELFDQANQLITDNNAGGFISMHGAVPHQEIGKLLGKADVYILPSKRAKDGDMEGIPVALMEAMASGVIVLSTYHSGIPELVSDGVTGFLCEPSDVFGLEVALLKIANCSQIELGEIRKNAREFVVEEFDFTKNTSYLLNYLRGNNKC